jgi:hypothetical protein
MKKKNQTVNHTGDPGEYGTLNLEKKGFPSPSLFDPQSSWEEDWTNRHLSL